MSALNLFPGAGPTKVLALALALTSSLAGCASDDSGSPQAAAAPSASASQAATPAAQAVEAGLTKHVKGDLDGAKADYLRALDSEPGNVLGLYNLGLIAQTQGDDTEAEKRYRTVLAVDATYQPAVFNLAIIRKAANDLVGAEKLYRQAIQFRPGDAGAHLNLGLLLRETGRQALGDAEVATALKLNPEFVDPATKK